MPPLVLNQPGWQINSQVKSISPTHLPVVFGGIGASIAVQSIQLPPGPSSPQQESTLFRTHALPSLWYPDLHENEQSPWIQAGEPLAGALVQARSQIPQFRTVARLSSHPVSYLSSQSPHPSLQMSAHWPSRQARVEFARSLAEAVRTAHELASPGDVVLLSPACASYDMFENYQQRGHQFAELARGFAAEL